jgi:hypothetical protein
MGVEDIRQELRRVVYSDGYIAQAQLQNGQAIVTYQDYQGQPWRFEFGGVVLFRAYEFGGRVEGVWATDDSAAIAEAVSVIESDGGRREGYPGLVAADFCGDGVMMTVVFQTLHISNAGAV